MNIHTYTGNPRYQEWFIANPSFIKKSVKNFSGKPIEIIENIPKKIGLDIEPTLARQLRELEKTIVASKYLKNLEEIDFETGQIVHNYKPQTWIRAVTFLIIFANWALKEEGITIPSPKIYDGPNGSIDVCWKGDNYRLLVNFPENIMELPTYYGDNYDDLTPIKSKISLKNQVLAFINILSILEPSYVAH